MRLHETRMIELVIRISEEDYETMKHNVAIGKPLCSLSEDKMVFKVANGTPLPKGHGRLKDIDAIIDTLDSSDRDIYVKECLEEDTPTILPADTESEEEE